MGGRATIEVPHVKGLDAFRDPTHKSFFTVATMDYFTRSSGCKHYTKARFKIASRRILLKEQRFRWLEFFYNLKPEFTEHFLVGYFKPHIRWELEKEKSDENEGIR